MSADVQFDEISDDEAQVFTSTTTDTSNDNGFVPPGVRLLEKDPDVSSTYHSAIPVEVLKAGTSEGCVLGVDEAGRGPVLGAMVYALSYCLKSYSDRLPSFGFADSKTLTHDVRVRLFSQICNDKSDEELYRNIGYATRTMSARDVSSGMLRSNASGAYNLNEQAHDTTITLISEVLKAGVNVTEIYVDTVGPPASYQAKLARYFPGIKVTVTKKADSLFPIVSVASICAKVTRDIALMRREEMLSRRVEESWGSGYPGDARTVRWLKEAIDPVFGWTNVVRFSWQTTKDLLDKDDNVKDVEWIDSKAGKLQFKPPKEASAALWFGTPVTSQF
ncbi:ribonuclease H2 subunit A [Myxozyma melibiosi]|uniref:Ribonuclease n=1 Tax=Myxozyma melibiosi TaxID=54550 RepID=A0ABR1F277_9ASCO